uniref:Uncharacterized protein n=1 Tax=Oryzias latipes TaxID=8090 RepID=A0A3P9HK96_ORYLA
IKQKQSQQRAEHLLTTEQYSLCFLVKRPQREKYFHKENSIRKSQYFI